MARLPLLCDVWQVDSSRVLAAAAAGIWEELISARGSHRALSRHAVLVRGGRCLRWACVVGAVRVRQRALKARNG